MVEIIKINTWKELQELVANSMKETEGRLFKSYTLRLKGVEFKVDEQGNIPPDSIQNLRFLKIKLPGNGEDDAWEGGK